MTCRIGSRATADWQQALPLLRLQGERIKQGDQLDVIAPNMFAGSILDLEPDTAYEARFVLSRSRRRAAARRTKTVTVRTRPEPMPAAGGDVYHVYPPGYKGAKIEPSFEGLMCAYNLTCAGTDWATAGRPRVKAGDTILVHAGVYKYNRYEYTNDPAVNRTTPLDGTYYLLAKGTAEKPIVIKGAGDGEAIFDGAGNFALFDVQAADYTYFEGLTFRNTDYAILGRHAVHRRRERPHGEALPVRGRRRRRLHELLGIEQLLHRRQLLHRPRRSRSRHRLGGRLLEAVRRQGRTEVSAGDGDRTSRSRCTAPGTSSPTTTSRTSTTASTSRPTAIRTARRRSAARSIRRSEYCDRRPVSIDFYNNYMTNFHDNPFEVDGSMHNVRVMRNMMINSASHAFCNQPAIGGPVYWIRNIAYHMPGGSTRLTGGSAGVIFYNNTDPVGDAGAGRVERPLARTTCFSARTRRRRFSAINTYTNYTSSDYNGFRPNPGAPYSFAWNSPPWATAADYSPLMRGRGAGPAPRHRRSRRGSTARSTSTAAPRIRISTACSSTTTCS